MELKLIIIFILALSGCLSNISSEKNQSETNIYDLYDAGYLFNMRDCEGVEIASNWIGPPGPRGPAEPPAGWNNPTGDIQFIWAIEVLECQHIGWGPLERGPFWIAIEFHNYYKIPTSCLANLDEVVHAKFLHGIYIDDSKISSYANSWAMPVKESSFSIEKGITDSLLIGIKPNEGKNSTLRLQSSNLYDGNATDTTAAFFWFEGPLVHRLALYRETKTTVGDAAILDMSPPSILADRPAPSVGVASRLSDLSWTGDLVTFSDPSCTTQVFP